MADLDKILEENGDLLLKRIEKLKECEPGSEDEKGIMDGYEKLMKQHIELTKAYESAIKNDNDDDLARKRVELEGRKIDVDEKMAKRKLEQDGKSEKTKLIQGWGTIAAALLVPIGCEVLKQGMHLVISNKVLTFEKTGVVTSMVGKAEFRK